MTPSKRNEGIQYRERQTGWKPGHLALNETLPTVDPVMAAALITIMEIQILRMMGK
jgi:hypothetical protein